MMDKKDEMLIIAEKALRSVKFAAKDAKSSGKELSATYVIYTTELALAKIQQLKQSTR